MPLRGTRVVDLTRILAGPYATMILGDYGADVVKIEQPERGDDTRGWGPPWVPGGASAYFTAVNRNKRSCTLDLKREAGRQVLWRLIERADVLISNFRAGVLARLGIDYEAARERNPRLVYAVINGYGESGTAAAKPSFDVIVQGESGIMDVTGFPDGPPTRVGISLGDETAGLLAVQGILAALLDRTRTGEGQKVEVALHDGLLSLLTYHAQGWLSAGARPQRLGNAHPSIVPYQTFPTSDGWINVGVGNDRQWEAFCRVLGRAEWRDDPRYRTNSDRVVHRGELVSRLEAIFAERPTSRWIAALSAAEIPCGRIRTVPEALDSPEAASRDMVVEIETDGGSRIPVVGPPVKLSGTPAAVRRPPPQLGEHTDQVLAEAGYTPAEIDAFHRSGVV